MAAHADASTEITPETIGRAFVSQFYQILHEYPERVYCFYNDQSTMSRPGPSGNMVTVTTTEEIKDLLLSLDSKSFKAEILTADTQASHMNGVTVLVTGILTGQDNLRRKFTESFFLAPQDPGFFVLNDTFRFIEEYSLPVMDPVEEECEKNTPAEPVSSVALVDETAEVADIPIENHTAVVKEIVDATTVPVDQQKSIPVEEAVPQPPADISNLASPAVEVLTNGDVDAPKMSYASLLMNGKQAGSAVLERGFAKPVKRNVGPKSVQQTQAPNVPEPAAPAAPAKLSAGNGSNGNASSNGHTSSNGNVAAPGHSIYIGHLPNDARPDLVEREFKRFGRIKKNGIQVRSNNGYTFGFVEFEEVSAQESALQMGTIQIDGREVQIEEKKTAARADDYPSGRGGRGGYRNDGFRRGNFSNGRGYGRNDYGKRNGEGPPRGRGNGDGNGYQNGGARGARQGVAPK